MPFGAPTSTASLVAFRTMFDPEAAAGLEAHLELELNEETFRARVIGGTLERGQVGRPGAVIESDTATLEVTGDRALAERFFTLFKLPEPVERAASG